MTHWELPNFRDWVVTPFPDRVLASSILLGHKVPGAIHAVILGFHSGETLPSQHLSAGNTHKAVGRPGLMILIMIPPDGMALLRFMQHVENVAS